MTSEQDKKTDPLDLMWQALGELGKPTPYETMYVAAFDDKADRWWILLKDIPTRLAEYIVSLHNRELQK